MGFYRQALKGGPATPVITGVDSTGLGAIFPRVSPDGKWIIYSPFPKNYGPGVMVDVLRVPMTGGTPQLILRDNIADTVRCAQSPATICAIAIEPDKKHLVVTSFDPSRSPSSIGIILETWIGLSIFRGTRTFFGNLRARMCLMPFRLRMAGTSPYQAMPKTAMHG